MTNCGVAAGPGSVLAKVRKPGLPRDDPPRKEFERFIRQVFSRASKQVRESVNSKEAAEAAMKAALDGYEKHSEGLMASPRGKLRTCLPPRTGSMARPCKSGEDAAKVVAAAKGRQKMKAITERELRDCLG